MNPDELAAHFKVCDCHDSWDQCPCGDAGHPADRSCGCCPLGIGLCGPLPKTLGERFDEIMGRMDAAYEARRVLRHHKPGSPEVVAADDAIEAVYLDLRALNADMKGKS